MILKKRMLTPIEVEALYSTPEGTLANWRWAGKGPRFYKRPNGRRVYYTIEDLERYFLSQPIETDDSVRG